MRKKQTTKVKKKHQLAVLAPTFLHNKSIGNLPIEDPSTAVGRKFYTNLMPLTGDFKKQIIDVGLEIDKLVGEKAQTRMWAFRIKPTFIKRVVRKKRDRVDLVIDAGTKDGQLVRVKLLFVTNANTYNSVKNHLRSFSTQFVKQFLASKTVEDFTQDIIEFRMQAELRNNLHKIYPLKACLVRSFKVLRELTEQEKSELEGLAKARETFVAERKASGDDKPKRRRRITKKREESADAENNTPSEETEDNSDESDEDNNASDDDSEDKE